MPQILSNFRHILFRRSLDFKAEKVRWIFLTSLSVQLQLFTVLRIPGFYNVGVEKISPARLLKATATERFIHFKAHKRGKSGGNVGVEKLHCEMP